jgi:carboxymethylenebutenolidase
VSHVEIPGVDGDLFGELRRPEVHGDAPAVIVLPEIDGFCAGTVAAAQRLAEAGYVALALDLYAPYGGTPTLRGMDDTMAWLARLNDRRQLSDLVMALAWLRDVPGVDRDRIAVLGFSIGGRYAMMLTAAPYGLRSVVAFYSRPWPAAALGDRAVSAGEYVERFEIPVCAVFGTDDEIVPLAMAEEFGKMLLQHPTLDHEFHIVPGRHFFANESRTRRYVAESAEAAWASVLGFLANHLSGAPGGERLPTATACAAPAPYLTIAPASTGNETPVT